MYILIPLGIVLVSLVGIVIIVSRKFSYLKKLTPESHAFGATLFHDFFPELVHTIKEAHLEQYLAMMAREFEKLLRRIRLVFSRIDSASSSLITELRSMSTPKKEEPAPATPPESKSSELSTPESHIEIRSKRLAPDAGVLRAQEQHLIIEIAQHPKDGSLYAKLGEIYLQLESYEDAVESFEAAIDLDKENKGFKERLSVVQKKIHENKVGF